MYSYEDRKRAVELYIEYNHSAADVIHELGYPNRQSLRNWYKDYLKHGEVRERTHEARFYSDEEKARAVGFFLEHGRSVSLTLRALGYPSKQSLYEWVDEMAPGQRRISPPPAVRFTYGQKADAVVTLATRKASAEEVAEPPGRAARACARGSTSCSARRCPARCPTARTNRLATSPAPKPGSPSRWTGSGSSSLRRRYRRGRWSSWERTRAPTRTGEKTLLVQALRADWPLNVLIDEVGLARSSYQYQVEALSKPDKYADLRVRVTGILHGSGSRYGHRRIHLELRKEGTVVSGKVVCFIMEEEGLVAKGQKRRRRHGSYQGEVSEAPENLVKRGFHAGVSNRLWLTDITGFHIPAGKVRLSPVIDCFDGMAVGRRMSTSPNAELANSALKAACLTLKDGEHPRIHSDSNNAFSGIRARLTNAVSCVRERAAAS